MQSYKWGLERVGYAQNLPSKNVNMHIFNEKYNMHKVTIIKPDSRIWEDDIQQHIQYSPTSGV